jgi:hypothetical protein
MPRVLRLPESFRNAEFNVRQRHDGVSTDHVSGFTRELICTFVARSASVSLHPLYVCMYIQSQACFLIELFLVTVRKEGGDVTDAHWAAWMSARAWPEVRMTSGDRVRENTSPICRTS